MKKRIVLLAFSTVFGMVGCSTLSISRNPPSQYDRFELCDRYSSFLNNTLSIATDAEVDRDPVSTEDGRIVGWSTICDGRHADGELIGTLQVHCPQLDGALEVPSYLHSLAGFEGKAWMGAPLPYWTKIYVQDGTWSAAMSFVKESPEQELLGHDDIREAAEFLVQVAHDLQG